MNISKIATVYRVTENTICKYFPTVNKEKITNNCMHLKTPKGM